MMETPTIDPSAPSLPIRIIQHHPDWEILSYLRFRNLSHYIDEIGIEFAFGLPTPILINNNTVYSGSTGLYHHYNDLDKNDINILELRSFIQSNLIEPMNILMIRYQTYQPERWFGTAWIMSYYQNFLNHFILRNSKWTITNIEDIIQHLSNMYSILQKKYLNSSKYLLSNEIPSSCDALLFSHLIKLYTLQDKIPELQSFNSTTTAATTSTSMILLRNYFENICNEYFRNNSQAFAKDSNDILFPISWRSNTSLNKTNLTMKQKEVYLVYGEDWKQPTLLDTSKNDRQDPNILLRKWIRNDPCITSSFIFPKFDKSLFQLTSWTSKVISDSAGEYIYVSYGGLVFTSVVMSTFIFSIYKNLSK